ncbi:hypothetical protein D3C72_439080 [compost metagenome]
MVDLRLLATACRLGEATDGLVLEQVLGAEHDAGLARAADHLHRDDGVAAQFEEIVFQADVVDGQHVLPDRGEGFLQLAAWRDVFALLLAAIHRWQGLAVELAVGGQRQLSEEQQERRDHVVRQVLAQRCFQGFTQGRLRVEVVQQRRIVRHDVGHQLLTAGAVLGQHRQFAHATLLQQPRFDFAQLDTEATDLDLMVDTADVLQGAVGLIAGQVAGAIQAIASAGKRIGYIFFSGQARPCEVTTGDARAAQVQLGGHALGHRLQFGIEQIAGGVLERAADIGVATGFAAGPGGIGGVFRRAIQIVDMLDGRVLVQSLHQALLERLTGQVDDAHARRDLPVALQCVDRRWYGVDQAYLIPRRQLRQLQGVAGDDQRATVGQGDEQLPHRQVEAHRRGSQHALNVVAAVNRSGPVDQRQHIAMGDGYAFGFAGGTGGVDHVGEIVRRDAGDRGALRVVG